MIGILTEKPSAMRNFSKALGGNSGTYNNEDYLLVSARGHLFELEEPDKQVSRSLKTKYASWDLNNLPWNIEDFSWKRKAKSDSKDLLDEIEKELANCDEIVIATDDDPTGEGELLAWEILDALALRPKKWSRMYFEDEAVGSIQKAFKSRKPIKSMQTDMDYLKADYRSRFDFLTMQFTRIATKYGDGHSVLRQGRLKSAMVLIVGQQLDLIAAYKRIPWYQNRFKDENGIIYTDNEEPKYAKENEVPKKYHDSDVVVDGKSICHTAPPKLLDLAGLSARLSPKGYSAQQVLSVYQKMYESQVVSYPRTEDKVITPEQFNELLPLIDKIASVVDVDASLLTHRQPRKTHVKAGGAHGANRPGPNVPDSLDSLSKYDMSNTKGLAAAIYDLLARNYLAMVAEDYEYEQQKGHVKDYPSFKGIANVPKSMGWKKVFDADDPNEDDTSAGLGTHANPFVYEGAPTKPQTPTMKWLMKQLEKRDVGTGATRTSIYADVTSSKAKYPLLIDRKGKISMAPAGEMSYRLLPNTHIGDLTLTEQLQADMRLIAEGKANPDDLLVKVAQMVVDDKEIMAENSKGLNGNRKMDDVEYVEGTWNGKDIKFKRVWSGYEFSDEEIEKLLDGEEIELHDVVGKSGKSFSCKGRLEEGNYKGKPYVGFNSTEFLNDGKQDNDYCYGVWNGMDIKFKKTWGDHEFSDDECRKLLDGEEISFNAKSKKGANYTAKGKLAEKTYKGNKFIGFEPDFGS